MAATYSALRSTGMNPARAALKAADCDAKKALKFLRQQWLTMRLSYTEYMEAYMVLS